MQEVKVKRWIYIVNYYVTKVQETLTNMFIK
jgi:hypothetical protein